MSLRTNESLQKMFDQSKLRQEKLKRQREKEKKEQKRLQQILNKNSLRSARKQAMDNLSNLMKKTQHEEKEQRIKPSYDLKVYNSDFVERYTNEEDLFQSWDELKEWEQQHYPCINWERLQEIIQLTKQQINQYERNQT